jgi:hypothetical protein
MAPSTSRSLSCLVLTVTVLMGCGGRNEAARKRAEAEAARAESEAANAKPGRTTASTPSVGGGASLDSPSSTKSNRDSLNRRAAEWVLGVEGELRVRVEGRDVSVAKGARLPDGPFAVEYVNVSGRSKLTNDGARVLAGADKLKMLYAEGNPKLTDYKFLEGLIDLEQILLTDSGVDDAAIASMKGLTKVGLLRVGSNFQNGVTDAGLEQIKGMTALNNLDLVGTRVSDEGLKTLSSFKSLERLSIGSQTNQSAITDAGLARLASVPNLRHLIVVGTKTTDVGLEHLKSQTKLQTLGLHRTRASDAGVASFKKALPECKVEFVKG